MAALDEDTTSRLHLPAATSTIVLSQTWPRAGLYPGIDPRGTVGPFPDADHEELATTARDLITRYLEVDPALTFDVDEPASWVKTAQSLLRALTQPFHSAEPFTGTLGEAVSIADTLELIRAVLADAASAAGARGSRSGGAHARSLLLQEPPEEPRDLTGPRP